MNIFAKYPAKFSGKSEDIEKIFFPLADYIWDELTIFDMVKYSFYYYFLHFENCCAGEKLQD